MPREVKKAGDKRGAGSGGGGSSSLDLIKERGSEPLGEGERVLNWGVPPQEPDRSAPPERYGFMKAVESASYQEGTSAQVSQWARKAGAERLHEKKDVRGKSKHAVEGGKAGAKRLHEKKDEEGRSMNAVKGGKAGAESTNAEKDERGRSKNAVKGGKVRAEQLRVKRAMEAHPELYNTAGELLDNMNV